MTEPENSFLIPKNNEPGFEDEKFSFTARARKFDQHIDQSIRGYSFLRRDVVAMSRYFVENDTNVIDIGCSQGTLLRNIRKKNIQAPDAVYYGIDINEAFQKHWNNEYNLFYETHDISSWDGFKNISLVTSLFTFQFMPERHRLNLLQKIYDNLVEGGALIFSEKVFSNNSKVQNMMEFLYYDYKREKFSEKQILDKEFELRHLAKLSKEEDIIRSLENIGYAPVQCFWRNYNFVGFFAIKPVDVG